VLVAGLVICVVVTLLLSVAGPEPQQARTPGRAASRGWPAL